MNKQIILCGASSVGKTTLAREWCKIHKEYRHIQEIARDIMREKAITRPDLEDSLSTPEKKLFLQLQYDIIEEQNRRESESIANHEPFISDRGPDPVAYVKQYCPNKLNAFLKKPSVKCCFERYRNSSLCIILCPLKSTTDDGVRLVQSTPDQDKFNKILCCILRDHGIPYIYMECTDLKNRLEVLKDAVKGKFPLPEFDSSPVNVPFHAKQCLSSKCVQLRYINITSEGIHTLFSDFSQGGTNRMVDRYGEDNLLLLSFNRKFPAENVCCILHQGLFVNGEEYNFLGSSSSGLKSRTCYMLHGSKERAKEVRMECGDFSNISSVSKRLKRIGMLFSEVKPTNVRVDDKNVVICEDIENSKGDVFTDGCGKVGTHLAKQIAEGSGISSELPERYLPSVYQIRYQGCKGVVAVDPDVGKHQLMIRKSMKKFDPGSRPFPEIWLCEHSRPYSYGHLNKQYIMLLSGLGVKDEVFLEKQRQHFGFLDKMLIDPETAIMVACWKNRPGLAAEITKFSSVDQFSKDKAVHNKLFSLKTKLMSKIEKLRTLIPHSRNIFGVCDPCGVLHYGQCFIRPTIRGKPHTVTGRVTVGKNPCYLLGDIRVLEAVDDPRLHHLVDCLVFPTEGKRPHPSEIAGSDLDGDEYFVCWDEDLIPPSLREPYGYPAVESPSGGKVDDSAMFDYFSRQNGGTMGILDKYYMFWASKEGIKSEKCDVLGKLFSRSVDASKTGDVVKIPPYLKPQRDEFTFWQNGDLKGKKESPHVWEQMEFLALEERDRLKSNVVEEMLENDKQPAVSEEFLWDLLEDKAAGISEYQLFLVVQKWCQAQSLSDNEVTEKLRDFSESINFAQFTTDQKLHTIDLGIPTEQVTNALSKSRLLTKSMMSHFNLSDMHCYWNLYFHRHSSEFQWKHLLRAILSHQESLLVFQLPDEVIFMLHFLTRLKVGKQEVVPGSVIAYFFSPHFDFYSRRVLSTGYSINITNELMQLFEGNVESTFMWIKPELLPKRGEQETEFDRVSIDLTRFKQNILRGDRHPRVNKQNYLAIEVYVKSFESETGYLDLYEPDQPDDLDPVLISNVEEEDIDILPTESKTHYGCQDALEDLELYSQEVALSNLSKSASACDCKSFLMVLQIMLSCDKEISSLSLNKNMVDLLMEMTCTYPPLPLPQETKETLQTILVSIQSFIRLPLDCLKVLDALCRLQCLDLVTPSLWSSIDGGKFNYYFDCMKEWCLWSFLPLDLALKFVDYLHSVFKKADQKKLCDIQELIEIAQNPNLRVPCDNNQQQDYVCHFLYLLVQHLINEMNEVVHGKCSISRMKAYKYREVQQPSPAVTSTLVGFRTSKSVAPKPFKQGCYVIISAMTKAQHIESTEIESLNYCPLGVGQVVQFERYPTDIVVEIAEPVSKCLLKSAELGKGHWCLQILGNVTAFKRAVNSLLMILDSGSTCSRLTPLLVHPAGLQCSSVQQASTLSCVSTQGDPLPMGLEPCEDDALERSSQFNPSQQRAIDAALSHRLTLIHGPPGTGKTHVACEIVRQVCLRSKEKGGRQSPVLVAAETNMAVDNLARKLLNLGLRVVRIGGEGHVSSDIHPITLEQQVERKRIELGKNKKVSRFQDTSMVSKILKSAEVVAVTCTGAGDTVLKDTKFEFVVIDEATQATEPVSLIPIVHKCCQLTLIGDPQQLAPIVPEAGKSFEEGGLKITLFHRFQKLLPSFFLDLQYRMHPILAEFPSTNFYCGNLKSGVSPSERALPNELERILNHPLIFVDTSANDQRIGKSFKNHKEIEAIKSLVNLLLKSNISPDNIIILTPYIGQVQALGETIPKHIKASTIDSFQGRERDFVIFSTVRCNATGNIGFLNDQYRINVLLTRAKKCLIGVGSKSTLCKGSPIWNKWFQAICVISQETFIERTTEHNGKKAKKPESTAQRTARTQKHQKAYRRK